jgi:hypothetical protein
MTFQRFYIPAVRFRAFAVELENLDGQGLRMEWEVKRDNTSTPDEGSVRLYNLAPAISSALYELWVARAPLLAFKSEIEIGWDGVPQRLMIGDTWDMIPQERTPTDVITVFRFGDGGQAFRDQTVGRNFNGTRIDQVLQYLIELPPAGTDVGGGGLGLEYPKESRALVIAAANATVIPVVRNLPSGRNTRQVINQRSHVNDRA